MSSTRSTTTTSLAKGASVLFDRGQRIDILCESGGLWLTEDNNIRDVVLEAGERFTFDGSGSVLAHALRTTSFVATVSAPVVQRVEGSLVQRVFARLQDAFRQPKPVVQFPF